MTSYTKLDTPRDVEAQVGDCPPAKVANPANRGGGKAPATHGYQQLTLPGAMQLGDCPPAKVANPANRREGGEGAGPPASPLTPGVPCVVCGGLDRWDDAGI